MRKNHHFYTLSTFYTKLKSHTNRKSDTICSFAPHNVCQSLPKPKKTKKPKKQKKNKKTHPNPPDLLHPMGLFFLFFFVFFVFFGFLEVFATFGGKPQENQKKQKNTPQPPRSSPSHGFVFFCFFCFFWFSRGFCHFWWKALRKPKNTCITLYKLFNCSNLFHVFISCFSIHYLCLIYPFNHLMTWSGRWPPGAFNLIYLYNLRKMN